MSRPYGDRTDEILALARQVRATALRRLAAMEVEADQPEDERATDGAEASSVRGRGAQWFRRFRRFRR
ncbi:hypothetical protein MF406_00580 [Georgenia sp. TF02-10]|uniref:hypothetical protein n=1 Tax=Georgenia sp. TF02-10 TaxID=2917725 RepID=UPI001FA70A7D|nr:hypothetical protein [Georgenia sp. TF02-10]UNX54836.1 hypothetical protein MF406_00580 [Georgenia sp. TF02-10]